MTSKQRIMAAWSGEPVDHIPLTTWCFGFSPPEDLRWETDGQERKFWYSLRMEHIHTMPQPWGLRDDFKRVLAWQSLGVDDLLDVSVPWSSSPEVTWKDHKLPAGEADKRYPVMVREYQTPAGPIRHAIKQTGEEGEGWPIQPDYVPLFEDYNIPRATDHAVTNPEEIPAVAHLYMPPNEDAQQWFVERMELVKAFADEHSVAVQAWSAFGMDAAVWLTGGEGAVMMAMLEPDSFGELIDTIFVADLARIQLAAATPGVDAVVQRGWYSSTDFWSPDLFNQFVYPHLVELVDVAHSNGVKFAYVMTTGVEILGPRLADAGVDILYFVDPVQDKIKLEVARELLGDRMTLVGAANALTLQSGDEDRIREEVHRACEILGPTNRFILHPIDAIFPDTPWEGITAMIEAWEECR